MNVVFDLGGVLFNWDPYEIVSRCFAEVAERELVMEGLLKHPDWQEMDRGTFTYEEVTRRASERTGIPGERIKNVFEEIPRVLRPKEDTVELLHRVKQAGYPLYVLSNMPTQILSYLESHEFMSLFDGKIYSCETGYAKPDREIYRILLDRFSLASEETVFIDDYPQNHMPAKELGIRTILFTGAGSCREELDKMGLELGDPAPV